MANEIQATYDSGASLYVHTFNAAGQIWDDFSENWGTYIVANWSFYVVNLAEIATNSGQYRVTFNKDIDAGVYSIVLYLQLGGSPASTDTRIGETAIMEWDGSNEITRKMLDDILDIAAADVANIDGDAMRGTDGANTAVPDVAGTAAGLHGTTDGKVDAVKTVVDVVQTKTDNLPADPASVTNQTTLLNRIGAFTGSGINTILGFLKALLSKAASAPSDVGGTFNPAADSTEAIRDRGDAAWITGGGGAAPTVEEIDAELSEHHGVGEWLTGGGGAAPTVEEIDAELTSQHGADSWQTSGSVGADSKTITISDGDGNPIDGVTVWITTDIAGSNVVRNGTTNASGEWTFRHDFAVGTVVYVWAQKSGYNFTNPTARTI